MRVDVIDEHRQRLRRHAALHRARRTRSRGPKHDPRIAQIHLRALRRIAVAIVFGESEHTGQPGGRGGNVPINNVREDDIGRYGAILHKVCL
jgi:hypothetical protein